PPERNRLRHDVGTIDVDEYRVAADDVADTGEQAGTGGVRRAFGALKQQRGLVPHQLATPDSVRGAAGSADVVAPDLRWREVGRALVERVEQPQYRLVLDALEPLSRLRRLTGTRQILEELAGFPGNACGPQGFDEKGAAASLRRENQVCRSGHKSLTVFVFDTALGGDGGAACHGG